MKSNLGEPMMFSLISSLESKITEALSFKEAEIQPTLSKPSQPKRKRPQDRKLSQQEIDRLNEQLFSGMLIKNLRFSFL